MACNTSHPREGFAAAERFAWEVVWENIVGAGRWRPDNPLDGMICVEISASGRGTW